MPKATLSFYLIMAIAASAPAATNYILKPDVTLGTDGLESWQGYNETTAQEIAPSDFVSVSGGAALVRGIDPLEGNNDMKHRTLHHRDCLFLPVSW